MNYQSSEDLFAAIGMVRQRLIKVVNKLKETQDEKSRKTASILQIARKSSKKILKGLEGLTVFLLQDVVLQFRANLLSVLLPVQKEFPYTGLIVRHLKLFRRKRLMDIQWAGVNTNKTYNTTIRIETAEKLGLLKDVISGCF